jgi:hypothetical protein
MVDQSTDFFFFSFFFFSGENGKKLVVKILSECDYNSNYLLENQCPEWAEHFGLPVPTDVLFASGDR